MHAQGSTRERRDPAVRSDRRCRRRGREQPDDAHSRREDEEGETEAEHALDPDGVRRRTEGSERFLGTALGTRRLGTPVSTGAAPAAPLAGATQPARSVVLFAPIVVV